MKKIAIMVGTVYGGAQYVAEEAEKILQQKGYQTWLSVEPKLNDLLAFAPDIWLVITSTTGQGDIPDNLLPFFIDVKDRFPLLTGKSYQVIALGDRGYGDTFCGAGRQWAELLAELQGRALAPTLEIDAGETLQPEDLALPFITEKF
ncbi:flavodoxin [Rheinheimera sp.]|uniref:flavodoxin n=1 Tax=Rheinheimera sp. TaxID=1869214 RepID=UPI00307E0B21